MKALRVRSLLCLVAALIALPAPSRPVDAQESFDFVGGSSAVFVNPQPADASVGGVGTSSFFWGEGASSSLMSEGRRSRGKCRLAVPAPRVSAGRGARRHLTGRRHRSGCLAGGHVLATLMFRAVGAGLATVDISRAVLGDTAGNELSSIMMPAATVEVTGMSVPEPALVCLTLTAAAALAFTRRRR